MADEQLAFGWAEPAPDNPPGLLPRAAGLADRLGGLARRGIYLGTSSWKYPGWLGQLYRPERYQTRGRFSQKRFNEGCLGEYAEVLPTVCGDFAFYQFPSEATWRRTFEQVPEGFRFSLKVPEEVTVERFADLPRYGPRAGSANPHFMDAAVMRDQLLGRLGPYRDRLGTLIFQFGTLHGPMSEPGRFVGRLDEMLSTLPTDRYRFAVEVRNRSFLGTDYLACLRSHGVAHCLNSWTRMPSIGEQLRIPGIITAGHAVGRFLLKPGRSYQQAVDKFAPYERIADPYPEGRDALRELVTCCLAESRMLFAFVNNRFEGNALETIELTTNELA